MKFLYFYERHVFAYDIFEKKFGTCSIVSSQTFLCLFALFADILFPDPDGFFLVLLQLVFISLLAA